jgi:predicted mannosyl-3-phosphoglycerate phosphatase (HAD superfamily)
VPEELSVGELGRTVNALRQEIHALGQGLNQRLDRVVSTEVYSLQSAYTDQRLTALSQEVQKVRDERDALENAFEAEKLAERDRRERERQARLYQMIVPILMGLLSAAIAVWAVVAK